MEKTKEINTLQDVNDYQVAPGRAFYAATHAEITAGLTTDVYFVKAYDILRRLHKEATPVVAEIFPRRAGILAGTEEALQLLRGRQLKVWSLAEGESFGAKDVVMRIEGAYNEFGLFETALLGILASSSAWATAARECKEAAGSKGMFSFGARHVHPAVAPVMERAALVGGADGASCILAAKLAGQEPLGTLPHAVFLIAGDTVDVAAAYDAALPPEASRLILIDTFHDEAEEALRVAAALKDNLNGVRLDTPSERGGVTPDLVREVRFRLDLAGFKHVQIFVSGGLNPERVRTLSEAGADAFGVGSYISAAAPIDMTMDLKEIDGQPVAKRGRLPGRTDSPRLRQVI